MGRMIIMSVGLGIIRKLPHDADPDNPPLDGNVPDLSAELSTLEALQASSDDKAIFIATDTEDCERAANFNARIAKREYNVDTEIKRIEGLVLDNAERFRREGLPSLVQELDKLVERAFREGREPLLSISGGIKPVVPYMAVYGMLRQIPVTYIFERTGNLITLPPLPLSFDWESLSSVENLLRHIKEEVMIARHELQNCLGGDFRKLEGLFEDAGEGQMTLSAFGLMLLNELKIASENPVMLSPSAWKKLEETKDVQRKLLDHLLDKVRIPLWRAQKRHTFHGTDLEVYKPGNTSHRLAGWVKDGIVYVAELYTSHDDYVRDLPNRSRNQYNERDFQRYTPKAEKMTEEELEKAGGDEMVAVAIREKERAEKAHEETLQMAIQYEEELKEVKQKLEKVKQEADKLRAEKEEKDSWGFLRRLRWAIFRS